MSATAAKRRLRLREDWARQSSPCRVDRDAGVIHDVKVCGPESANRRRYPRETFLRAVKSGVYEGAKVFADHPGKVGEQRPVKGILGRLTGIYEKDGDLRAKRFEILKSHPLASAVMEDCERGIGLFGLSHNAEAGDFHFENGVQVVTEIARVSSVDLVSDAATNTNLWEGRSVGIPLKVWLDEKSADRSLPVKARKQILEMAASLEQENGDEGPLMAAEPAPELDGRQLLAQAVAALVQSGDAADHDLAQKVMRLLKPSNEEPVEEEEDEDEENGKKPKESRKPRPAPAPVGLTEAEALELCALADVAGARLLAESITGLPQAAAQKVVLAHKSAAAAARRGSGPPRSASGHVPEASSGVAPGDRAKALQWLKE